MSDLNKIFGITDFFNNARWENLENYNFINYYKENLSNNVKILTHWLSYITDRQMPFNKIWDIGGFVFSNLLDELEINKQSSNIIEELLHPDGENSFFISRSKYKEKIYSEYKCKEDDLKKYMFVAKEITPKIEILISKYKYPSNKRPYFIPRFYPSDYFSIYSTLQILKEYDYHLGNYIIRNTERNKEKYEIIQCILFSLYLLTYHDIGQLNADNLRKYGTLKTALDKRKNQILQILENEIDYQNLFVEFKKSEIYNQKRAWCSLRDYFKSGLKSTFINLLNEINPVFVLKLFNNDNSVKNELFKDFELPGDVWNNNDIFRKCVFVDNGFDEKGNLSMYLRKIYKENEYIVERGYPEQFDITFDFVPRMCIQPGNCSLCPYGKINPMSAKNGKGSDFFKLCINDTTKYCPVLLVSTNYKMLCKGKECSLLKIIK